MPKRRLKMLEGDLDERRTSGAERADRLEGEVDTRRSDFDATEFSRQAAGAAFGDFEEDLGRGIENLRGEQVGMGRLRTGFATLDEDSLVQDLNRRLSQELARGAFTAASLDLRNVEGMGAEGVEARRGSDAALAGSLDRTQAELNEKRKKRRGLLGTLASGAGALIGGALGGPAGAAVGARVGGMVSN